VDTHPHVKKTLGGENHVEGGGGSFARAGKIKNRAQGIQYKRVEENVVQ